MADKGVRAGKLMPRGVATGIGSMPGLSIRESLDMVTDLVPELVYLPELPARGPGGEMIGRTFGLLNSVDASLGVETQPSGWRLTPGEGAVMRRAKSWLAEDIDALEEMLAGYEGWIKVALVGPVTLASSVEFAYGERMVSDERAVRDLTQALIAGIEMKLAELRRRLPLARWVVQIDEPWLGGALRGFVPKRSGLGYLRGFDLHHTIDFLGQVANAIDAAGAVAWLHTCENEPPMVTLAKIPFDLVSMDVSKLDDRAIDAIGLMFDRERMIGVGMPAPRSVASEKSVVDMRMGAMDRLSRRLSISTEELLNFVVVTPSCGLGYSENAAAELRLAGLVVDSMRGN